MKLLDELYAYREMIVSLVHRDLKGRYKNSVLGFAWTFVNPLLQLAVYTAVFSTIMRMGIKDYYSSKISQKIDDNDNDHLNLQDNENDNEDD